MFSLLITDEEHDKGANVELAIAKRMLKSHCDSSFPIEEGADGERGSIMYTLVGSDQYRKHGVGGRSPTNKFYCENYNKGGHTS